MNRVSMHIDIAQGLLTEEIVQIHIKGVEVSGRTNEGKHLPVRVGTLEICEVSGRSMLVFEAV
jgi:hypothetical protein